MAKIALCGITTNKNFSKNGEAKRVAKICALESINCRRQYLKLRHSALQADALPD